MRTCTTRNTTTRTSIGRRRFKRVYFARRSCTGVRLLGFLCSGAGQEAEAVLPFNRRGGRPARSCDLIRAEVAAGGLLFGADASDGPSRGEAAARRAVRDAVSVRSRAEAASSCRSLAGSSCFANDSAQTCSRVEACGAPVSTDAGLRAREASARRAVHNSTFGPPTAARSNHAANYAAQSLLGRQLAKGRIVYEAGLRRRKLRPAALRAMRLRAADPSRDRVVLQTTVRKPVLGAKPAERPCRKMRASARGRLRPAALRAIFAVRRPLRGRTVREGVKNSSGKNLFLLLFFVLHVLKKFVRRNPVKIT